MDRSPIRYPQSQLCTAGDCLSPVEGHGLCAKHYQRARKHGDADATLVEYDPVARFDASYVVSPAGCWVWTGTDRNQVGHARIHVHGQRVGAHRYSYERFIGPIPDGLVIDHLCKNPACVNPEHLEAVTQLENVARADHAITTINARKTHCLRGHEFTVENTRWGWNGARPRRQCRACARRTSRDSYLRKRAAATAGRG